MLELAFRLLVVHAFADYSLQIDSMAKGKNRHYLSDYIPNGQKTVPYWFYWLSAHALIHGGAVYLVTSCLWLGIAETFLHWAIDFAKCENWTNPHIDQLLHIACKAVYVCFNVLGVF